MTARTYDAAVRAVLLAVFALGAAACALHAPPRDAGPAADAAAGELHAKSACRLLSAVFHSNATLRDNCEPPTCPWSAPFGEPDPWCEPLPTLECIERVDVAATCLEMDAALAACAEVCR